MYLSSKDRRELSVRRYPGVRTTVSPDLDPLEDLHPGHRRSRGVRGWRDRGMTGVSWIRSSPSGVSTWWPTEPPQTEKDQWKSQNHIFARSVFLSSLTWPPFLFNVLRFDTTELGPLSLEHFDGQGWKVGVGIFEKINHTRSGLRV